MNVALVINDDAFNFRQLVYSIYPRFYSHHKNGSGKRIGSSALGANTVALKIPVAG